MSLTESQVCAKRFRILSFTLPLHSPLLYSPSSNKSTTKIAATCISTMKSSSMLMKVTVMVMGHTNPVPNFLHLSSTKEDLKT